jgi:hypothetical protein
MIYRVFYTKPYSWLYGKNADSKTFGNLIFIKREFKGDKCLLEHEKEHVRQNIKLQFNKCYRESMAYKKQYICGGRDDILFFIKQIMRYCDKDFNEIKRFLNE